MRGTGRTCHFTIRAAELDAMDRPQIAYKLLKKNTNLTNPGLPDDCRSTGGDLEVFQCRKLRLIRKSRPVQTIANSVDLA